MRNLVMILAMALLSAAVWAEDVKDAADHREEGIKALRESQTNQKAIVTAAKHFAKAAAIYEKAGETDAAVEANSFLYWCKKKMTLADIEAFAKAGEVEVSRQIVKLDDVKVEKTDAQTWFDRAEKFAAAQPDEHLLIAIRFFEVADRFKGTDVSLAAQDRSLKEQQLAMKEPAPAKPQPTPTQPATTRPAPEAVAKVAVPDAAKIKDAEKTIKDIFKDEYAKRGADDKKALGAKLLQQGNETKDDPVSRYVLLKEAIANAVAGGDAETVLKALDALGQSFEVDAVTLKAEALGKIVPTSADAAKSLARMCLKVIDEAVAADNYDAAVKLVTAGDAAARKAQDMPLVTQLTARGKEVRTLQTDFSKVKAAQTTLKDKPDDPEANLAVGKFLCFVKGDWNDGLPYLAKGNDAALKAVADLEGGQPTAAATQHTIADQWWEISEKLTGKQKTLARLRAGRFYEDAARNLDGLAKLKAEKRAEEIKKLSRESGTRVDLLKLIQLPKNVIEGPWKRDGFDLIGEGIASRVEIPYDLPDEYDLEIAFTQIGGEIGGGNYAAIYLTQSGRQFSYLQGWYGTLGFDMINGQRAFKNSTTKPVKMELKKRYQVTLKVRRSGAEAWIDGKKVTGFTTTDYSELSLDNYSKMRNSKWLGIGTVRVTLAYHQVDLVPKP